MQNNTWILGMIALTVGIGCGDPVGCPEGRKKLGSRCESLEQDAGSITALPTKDAGVTEDAPINSDGGPAIEEPIEAPMVDAGPQTCLVDLDGDGFGVEATGAACADAPSELEPGDCDDGDPTIHPLADDSCGDDRDNDCDGETDEGVEELCNGLDDDCDGVLENGFACEPGAELACTTSCGTQGTTTCNDVCEEPGVEACVPPAELCNWQDDDCDGVVDPGLLVAKKPTTLVSQYGVPRQVALLPRGEGQGAWLVTSNSNLNAASESSMLRFRWVSPQGQVGSEASLFISGILNFRAALEGKWLALLVTTNMNAKGDPLPSGRTGLDVILLDSTTLELVWRQRLTQTAGSCDGLWVSDIAIMDVAGETHVAAVFGAVDGEPNASGWCEASAQRSSGSHLVGIRYTGENAWSVELSKPLTRVPAGHLLFGPATFDAIERVPCREEWLVRHSLAEGKHVVTRFSLTGDVEKDLYHYDALTNGSEFFLGEVDCASPHSALLLARVDEEKKASVLDHFELSHADGSLRDLEQQTHVDAWVLQAAQSGGRWFTAGISTGQQTAMPLVHELTLEQAQGSSIVLGGASPSIPVPVVLFGARMLALTALDGAISFATGHGVTETDRAQAYVLGCP